MQSSLSVVDSANTDMSFALRTRPDGCDDCCHMDVISAMGMGEMRGIASVKRDIFRIDPHHLIWVHGGCTDMTLSCPPLIS
jgi:hypothetical protein